MKKERSGKERSPVVRILEVAAWVVVLSLVAYRFWPQMAAVVGVGRPGDPAPDFAVTTLRGEEVSLEAYRGQVVLVNFWATWCPPCRVEMPGFQSVYDDFKDEGFVILGLSTDQGPPSQVLAFLVERQITYPNAIVGESVKRKFGGVPLLPTSILIDREGRIHHRVEGFFAPPALRAAVRRLVREDPAS